MSLVTDRQPVPGQFLPLRRFLLDVEQGWSPSCENRPADEDEWGVLKVGCVNGGTFDSSEQKALPGTEQPLPELEIKAGDLLVSRANTMELVGSAALVRATRPRLLLCDKLFRLRLDQSRLSPEFLSYALAAANARRQIEAEATGASSSMQNIGQDTIRNLALFVPPLPTQARIAAFLDRKIATIDALIAKKERLLALLEEKRQALITQAVTRGLDPSAPMRDSGVEWLGEMPAHWNVVRISYVASVQNGSTPHRDRTDFWEGGTIPWLSSGKVNDYIVREADEFITPRAIRESSLRMLPADTVLVGMIGQGRTRGMSAHMKIAACINQNVAGIQPGPRLLGRFLHLVLVAAYEPLREFGRGGNQEALNCDLIGAFRVPLPPTEEQRHIAEMVDSILERDRQLAERESASIDRLREYRQAIITAAVTGKIDVAEQLAQGAQQANEKG